MRNGLNMVNSWATKILVNLTRQKMFITRKYDGNTFKSNLYFQTEKMEDVTNHKQASSDASRKPHLSNIISKGEKEMLRALMWKLERKPLEALYLCPI